MVPPRSIPTLHDLLPALLDELPDLLDEVVGLLREEWPDYAQLLSEDAEEVAQTAQTALAHLVTTTRPGAGVLTATSGGVELFEEVGRIEWREGRPLSSLLSAYRAGARVFWQRVSRLAVKQRIPADAVARLAEAVFVFVEELSSASARGYVEEQLATAAQRERMRAELAELLISERADLPAIHAAAAAAGWPLPRTVALVVVDPDQADGFFDRLDSRALPVRRPELNGAVIADPTGPGGRQRLGRALRGYGAVIGTPVGPEQLPATLRMALAADRLRRAGMLTDDPLFVDEHYDALIVHSDAVLLDLLSTQALAPLHGLPTGARERLEETLTVWLATMGDRQEVARRLHIHPQTVRYRLGRLRQLFGSDLDDPAARLRLTLALCWRDPGRP